MEQVYFHLRRDNGCEFGNGRSRQCYCISICRDNWSLGVTEQSRSGVDGTMRRPHRLLTQQVVESLASPMRDQASAGNQLTSSNQLLSRD